MMQIQYTESMATDKSEQNSSQGLISKVLKVVTLPVSAAIGYWFVSTDVRNTTYERLKRHKAFVTKGQDVNRLNQAFRDAIADVQQGKTVDLSAIVAPLDAVV